VPKPITQRELDDEDRRQTEALGATRARRLFREELGMPWPEFRDMIIHTELRAEQRARRRAKPRRGRLLRLDDLPAEPEVRQELAAAMLLAETLALAMQPLTAAEKVVVLLVIDRALDPPVSTADRNTLRRARAKIRPLVPAR
jgi:hypothetical protein